MPNVTIYHNPRCGTSRKVLGILQDRGIQPTVVEYLKTPPTKAQLKKLVAHSDLKVRDFLRTKEQVYQDLDLANPKWTEDQLLGFLAENPILLNRPVVETAKGAQPCRPAETVLELLD